MNRIRIHPNIIHDERYYTRSYVKGSRCIRRRIRQSEPFDWFQMLGIHYFKHWRSSFMSGGEERK